MRITEHTSEILIRFDVSKEDIALSLKFRVWHFYRIFCLSSFEIKTKTHYLIFDSIKGNEYTFRGDNFDKSIFPSLWQKIHILIEKNSAPRPIHLAPLESN